MVFFAGLVWTLARTQGEVGGDQEPPGDTWRHPIPPKKIILTKIIYGLQLLLVTNFDYALPSRGYSTDFTILQNFTKGPPSRVGRTKKF